VIVPDFPDLHEIFPDSKSKPNPLNGFQPSLQALSYKSSIKFPLLDIWRQSHNEFLTQAGKWMKLRPMSNLSVYFQQHYND